MQECLAIRTIAYISIIKIKQALTQKRAGFMRSGQDNQRYENVWRSTTGRKKVKDDEQQDRWTQLQFWWMHH